jgi:hypothetical protein
VSCAFSVFPETGIPGTGNRTAVNAFDHYLFYLTNVVSAEE